MCGTWGSGASAAGPLEELRLPECGLGASGVQALGESGLLGALIYLSLGLNSELGPDSAPFLGTLVARSPHLRRLNLQRTAVGDAGAAAVARAASQQGCLAELDLSRSGCGQAAG